MFYKIFLATSQLEDDVLKQHASLESRKSKKRKQFSELSGQMLESGLASSDEETTTTAAAGADSDTTSKKRRKRKSSDIEEGSDLENDEGDEEGDISAIKAKFGMKSHTSKKSKKK
jgi:hypothetical protein